MSKVIYLYNQNNVSSKDKLYDVILDFFKSMSTNLIIILLNYLFNDCLNSGNSIEINSTPLSTGRINYVPLDYSLPTINLEVDNKKIYSIEILNTKKNNFSLYILKYNKENNVDDNYSINLPETRILEFENNICTADNLKYTLKICDHALSYEIPVYKFHNVTSEFIKDNNLYALFPFTLFNKYNKIVNISKIGTNPEKMRKEILNLRENTYKEIKKLNTNNTNLSKKDYTILKDTIGNIIDYYLDSIYD